MYGCQYIKNISKCKSLSFAFVLPVYMGIFAGIMCQGPKSLLVSTGKSGINQLAAVGTHRMRRGYGRNG
jgi:hypothetical protein